MAGIAGFRTSDVEAAARASNAATAKKPGPRVKRGRAALEEGVVNMPSIRAVNLIALIGSRLPEAQSVRFLRPVHSVDHAKRVARLAAADVLP